MKTSERLLQAAGRLRRCRLTGSKNMHCVVCALGSDEQALDAAYVVNSMEPLRWLKTRDDAVAMLLAAAMFAMAEESAA